MESIEIFWGKYPPPPRVDVIYNNVMEQFRQEPLVYWPFLHELMAACYFGEDGDSVKDVRQCTHQLRLKVSQFVKKADNAAK